MTTLEDQIAADTTAHGRRAPTTALRRYGAQRKNLHPQDDMCYEHSCQQVYMAEEADAALAELHTSYGATIKRQAGDYAAALAERDRRIGELSELLGFLYDKWQNGDPCYQNGDVDCDSLGNAFKLSDEEESRILAALSPPPAVKHPAVTPPSEEGDV